MKETENTLKSKGRRVGYIRLNRLCRESRPQLEGIELDIVFIDSIRRKKQFLSQFHAMKRYVREGDTLIVQRMDRLVRSPQEFLAAVRELTRQGVCVECVTEQLVFPAGESSLMRNFLLLTMTAFHNAVQAWGSEKMSETRRGKSVPQLTPTPPLKSTFEIH